MKKNVVIFAVLFLTAFLQTVHAQGYELETYEEYYDNGQIWKRVTGYSSENRFMLHGTYTTWYENGQMDEQREYIDGKENGIWSYWLSDGILSHKYIYNLLNDLITYEWYYENGQIREQYTYYSIRDDYNTTTYHRILHGTYTEWYDNGQMDEQRDFIDGKITGVWSKWYSNGIPSSQSEFSSENDLVSQKSYHENGQISTQFTFYPKPEPLLSLHRLEIDMYHGKYTKWYDNGQMSRKGLYVYNQESGLWSEWDSNGVLLREYDYNLAQNLVVFKDYYENGQINVQYTYHLDSECLLAALYLKTDTFTEWYDNGQMFKQAEFKDGILDGEYTSWFRSGVLKNQGEYQNGKRHGLWIHNINEYFMEYLLKQGVAQQQIGNYEEGVKHGLWTETDGSTITEYKYEYGKRHGKYYSKLIENFHPFEKGVYGDGVECGVQEEYYDGTWYKENEYGPCPSRNFKFVEGYVKDVKTKRPIKGAWIVDSDINGFSSYIFDASEYNAYSNDSGYYKLIIEGTDNYAFDFFCCNYSSFQANLSKSNIDILLKPIDMNNESIIINTESKYGSVFLDGISLQNEYTTEIDWGNQDSGYVEFEINGVSYQVDGNENGAAYTLNMGSSLKTDPDSTANTFNIYSISKDGEKETVPFTLHPVVLPIPDWSKDLGMFRVELGDDIATYSLEQSWPSEPIEIQINQNTVGPTLWNIWKTFPFIGGNNFGILSSQATLDIKFKTNGEGEVTIGGQTGFEAAGQTIEGEIKGEGLIDYVPGQGLVWKGANLLLGINGTIKKTVGPVTLIPALESAENLPIVGRSLQWLNNSAEITGSVNIGSDVSLKIIDDTGTLGFHSAEGDISNGIGLGLSLNITDKISVQFSGSAVNQIFWQVPADPDYLTKIESYLSAKAELTAWLYTDNFEGRHTFSYPENTGNRRISLTYNNTGFQPVSRDFLNQTPYNQFTANQKRTRISRSGAGADEYKIIENVYPHAVPVLTEHQGKIGIIYVYFDSADTTLQATEINFIYYDGQNYTDTVSIKNDTRAEFSPSIAFDQNGKIVAVWQRVKNENFDGDIVAMVKEMEIVYAVYDSANYTWTEPAALTDNSYLDSNPMLKRGQDGNLLLTWISNKQSELVGGSTSPDEIRYALWNGTAFDNIETLPDTFENSFKFSLAYNGSEAILAYVKDMDGNLLTTDDEEIFYTIFDGNNWNSPARLTNDAVADVSPKAVYKDDNSLELIWLKDSTLVRLTNLNSGTYETIREQSNTLTFTDYRLAIDPQNNLILLWQNLDNKGIDLFYSIYDMNNNIWSSDLRLTEDKEMEKDFSGVFSSDGIFHLIFNKENPETGINNLSHLTYKLQKNLAVNSKNLSIESGSPTPGMQTTLICRVENKGDTALNNIPVSFYLGSPDNSGILIDTAFVSPAMLKAGNTGEAVINWTIPQDAPYSVYAVVDPDNTVIEADETDNTAIFHALKPELELLRCRITERSNGSVDIIAMIQNNGTITAENVEVLYQVNDEDMIVMQGPSIEPGKSAEVMYTAWAGLDFTANQVIFRTIVDPNNKIAESIEENNQAAVNFDASADLSDLIKILQIICGMEVTGIGVIEDINDDDRLGLEDAIYILQQIAEQ
ncbi:CARDB domain-containing protein [Desulfobacterales bacterium HSG17]|nr:CARDB domain-containing protein [Desulfobacterales bacterium HSG17]